MQFTIEVMNMLFIVTLPAAMPDISVQHPGICSNSSNGGPLECCPNYRIVGTTCEECWPGSRGVNCKEDCPNGFYGRFCSKACECYPCDKVKGCQIITKEDDGPARFHLFTILSLSLGGLIACSIVCLSIFCIFRLRPTATPVVSTETGNHNDETISLKLQHSLSQMTSSAGEASSKDVESSKHRKVAYQTNDPLYIKETNELKASQNCNIGSIDGAYHVLKLSNKNDVQKMQSEAKLLQKLTNWKPENTLERKRLRDAVGML